MSFQERFDITAVPPQQSDRELEICAMVKREFSEAQIWRNTTAAQWEEVAELILPNYRNTFFYGNYNYPGQKKTDKQVDASGMLALSRFAAICDSLLTPRNMYWHTLSAGNEDVMKDRATRLWFEQATKTLFRYRYAPAANFAGQNQQCYSMLGAFGTHGLFIDQIQDHLGTVGIRYMAIPPGELFLRQNHQGQVDSFIRWFRFTARQVMQKWGKDNFPPQLATALNAGSEQRFDFLHWVGPNDEFTPGRLDAKGKPWSSYYVALQANTLLQEGGYWSFPLAVGRYEQAPGEVYGRSPAMNVLPALKTLNAQKRTFLKVGHRQADPVLLTPDDGLVGISFRPGALNKGGMSPDGKPLIGVLPEGNIQISKEMMQEEKALINDAFLVTLFQILTETPQMTATEVIERTNEKGILIAPTMGRQQSEYLGTMIHRELDLAVRMRLIPPMPPALREARGEYETVYTSPLSRAMKAQEVAGFARTLETIQPIVQATGDQSLYDLVNFPKAMKAISAINAVPESWMAGQDEINAKAQARQKTQEQNQQIQAAPAAAGMMKAQAAQYKAGLQPTGPGAQQALPQQQGQPGQPQGAPGQ